MTSTNDEREALRECVSCGSPGKMIHPMGEWVSAEVGYGPDGARVTCTAPAEVCHMMTPAFYGEGMEEKAIAIWNRRPSLPAPSPAAGEAVAQLLAWADRALPMTDDASDFLNEGGWEQFGNIIARFRMSQMPEPLWQQGKGPVIREAQATEPSQRPRESHGHFLDGMQAAAEICGSLAETTYDDADQFEAATGCEAAIMECVRQGRAKQAAPQAPATGGVDPELIARVEVIASATGKDRWKIANLTGHDWRRILAALANHSPDAGGVGEATTKGDRDDVSRNDLVDIDHARLALFDAIGKIKIGNPTDDKLILDNLREAGFWICRLDPALRPVPRGEG